jgi:hypothetical protein
MALDTGYIAVSGKLTYSAGTPSFTGVGVASVADTGTGVATCTLSDPALAAKILSIQLTSMTTATIPRAGAISTTNGTFVVNTIQAADGSTATDGDCYVTILCSR